MTLWISGTTLLVVGAASVSHMIFILSGNAWELQKVLGYSKPQYFVTIFPFLWLVAFVLFLLVAQYTLKHTKKAYKYTPIQIAIALLLLSALMGIVFYNVNLSHKVDSLLGEKAPRFYETREQRREHMMHRPKKGHIVGFVVSFDEKNKTIFTIKNPRKGDVIEINASQVDDDGLSLVKNNAHLMIIGKSGDDRVFYAKDIHTAPPKTPKRRFVR